MSSLKVRIGDKVVRNDGDVFITAEIGINHNGFLHITKSMIDLAIRTGCDAVKFQKRTVPVVYSEKDLAKPRQVNKEVLRNAVRRGVLSPEAVKRLESSDFDDSTNGDLKWALEFSEDEYADIDRYCRERGILWFASPWDEGSVDFLERFEVPCHKVASASLTDDGLLKHICGKGKPVILSTGMSDMEMIRHAVEVLGTEDLVLLHCTSVYPDSLNAGEKLLSMINLDCINTLRNEFPGVPVGFSSHDSGIMPSYAAAAMGVCMIEKHITIERSMWGTDQPGSIEPHELTNLCRMVKELQIARGDGRKIIYEEEREVIKKLRRK